MTGPSARPGREPRYLSRTCEFGTCLVCNTTVTETAMEHFFVPRGGNEVFVGVTHPTCDIKPGQIRDAFVAQEKGAR